MHAALGDDADQVDRGASRSAFQDHLVFGERAVLDRLVDAQEVLRDDRARAEVEVAHLGVAHLAGRQAGAPSPQAVGVVS